MPGPWEKYQQSSGEGVAKPWEKYQGAPMQVAKDASPSIPESLARGAAQGVTLGLADEAMGAFGALHDVATDQYTIKDLVDRYRAWRDESRSLDDEARKVNPKSFIGGELAGGLVIPGSAFKGATTVGSALKSGAIGAAYGLGKSEADITKGDVANAAKDAAVSGTVGAVAGAVADKLPEFIKYLGGKSRAKAVQMAENSTGATRVGAEKFKDGTGEYLLDSGLIRPFQNQVGLAEGAGRRLDHVGEQIGQILKEADEAGITLSKNQVMQEVARRARALKSEGPGYVPSAKAMEGSLSDDITEALVAGKHDLNSLKPSLINKYKQSYKKVNWADPDRAMAQKGMYRSLMDAEEKAVSQSPELLERFLPNKKEFGMLDPIVEAAEKRAAQLKQSPVGGFNDIATTAAAAPLGLKALLTAAPLRRAIAPRVTSTGAYGFNQLSKILNAASGAESAPLATQAARMISAPKPQEFKYVAEKDAADQYSKRR